MKTIIEIQVNSPRRIEHKMPDDIADMLFNASAHFTANRFGKSLSGIISDLPESIRSEISSTVVEGEKKKVENPHGVFIDEILTRENAIELFNLMEKK